MSMLLHLLFTPAAVCASGKPHAELLLLLQANSTTLQYLVDYDSTQSMVIVNAAGQYIACTAMTPPLPDFPE